MRKVLFGLLGVTVGVGVGLLVYRSIDSGDTTRLVRVLRGGKSFAEEEGDENYRLALFAEHRMPACVQ